MACSSVGWGCQVILYTGDGTASRVIATNFPLDSGTIAVWIYPAGASSTDAMFRCTGMAGTQTDGSGGPSTAIITAFGAAGFTINANANTNAKIYVALVMRSTSSHLISASYAGNGALRTIAASAVTSLGAILINGRSFSYRSIRFTGDSSMVLNGDPGAAITNMVKTLASGTFDLGTDVNVNNAALTYTYLYFPGDGDIGSAPTNGITHFKVAGTGANLAITGLGFTPTFVIARALRTGASGQKTIWRSSTSHAGTQSQISGGGIDAATGIRSMDADGFSVGTALSVVGTDIYGFACEGCYSFNDIGCLNSLGVGSDSGGGSGCAVSLAG